MQKSVHELSSYNKDEQYSHYRPPSSSLPGARALRCLRRHHACRARGVSGDGDRGEPGAGVSEGDTQLPRGDHEPVRLRGGEAAPPVWDVCIS